MKNNPFNSDTSLDAELKQIQVLEKIGIEGRAKLTFELSDNMHQMVLDGIKHRHPDYDQESLKIAFLKIVLPPQLFSELFGNLRIAI